MDYPSPYAAITAIRSVAHARGVTPKQFDAEILPRMDALLGMKVSSHTFGIEVSYTIDHTYLNALIEKAAPPLDPKTLQAVLLVLRGVDATPPVSIDAVEQMLVRALNR